jgi:hypothetical protein
MAPNGIRRRSSRMSPSGRAILGRFTSDSGHDRPCCARCRTARSVSNFGCACTNDRNGLFEKLKLTKCAPRAGNRAGFFHARDFNCPVRKASVAGPLPNVPRSMARLCAGRAPGSRHARPLSSQHGEHNRAGGLLFVGASLVGAHSPRPRTGGRPRGPPLRNHLLH